MIDLLHHWAINNVTVVQIQQRRGHRRTKVLCLRYLSRERSNVTCQEQNDWPLLRLVVNDFVVFPCDANLLANPSLPHLTSTQIHFHSSNLNPQKHSFPHQTSLLLCKVNLATCQIPKPFNLSSYNMTSEVSHGRAGSKPNRHRLLNELFGLIDGGAIPFTGCWLT